MARNRFMSLSNRLISLSNLFNIRMADALSDREIILEKNVSLNSINMVKDSLKMCIHAILTTAQIADRVIDRQYAINADYKQKRLFVTHRKLHASPLFSHPPPMRYNEFSRPCSFAIQVYRQSSCFFVMLAKSSFIKKQY